MTENVAVAYEALDPDDPVMEAVLMKLPFSLPSYLIRERNVFRETITVSVGDIPVERHVHVVIWAVHIKDKKPILIVGRDAAKAYEEGVFRG